jgi:hypothetical protein
MHAPSGQLPPQLMPLGPQIGGVAQPQPERPGPKDINVHTCPTGHEPPHVGALMLHPRFVGGGVLLVVVEVVLVVGAPTTAGVQSRNDFRDRTL